MDSDVAVLRRRNSVPAYTIPSKLDIPINLQSSSFPNTNSDNKSSTFSNPHDFELVSLRSREYTSLKDLIPCSPNTTTAAMQSPTGSFNPSCSDEISIRNRLVKQAAWAYLQPMSTSPSSSGRCSFRQMWVRFSSVFPQNPVDACFGFFNRQIVPTISRAFNRLLGVISVWRNRA